MQHALGAVVVVAAAAAFLEGLGRRRGHRRLALPGMTPSARRAAMVLLVVVAAVSAAPALLPPLRRGIFALCGTCPVLPVVPGEQALREPAAQGALLSEFLLAAWYYAATVLPVFVLASLLSGVLLTRSDRFRVSGAWGSLGLAALLPVCSCGVVPLGRAIISRGGPGRRDGLIFLAAAPLLSPIIIALSFVVLGPAYGLLRIAASVAVAFAVAAIVLPFLPEPEPGPQDAPPGHDAGAPSSDVGARTALAEAPTASFLSVAGRERSSSLEAGLSTLGGLFRYALYGVVVGAAFTALLPSQFVVSLLRPGVLSMAAAVVVGLPVNMCGGEEILISAPLVGLGLGMGHAIAFALASTGICVGSIPLLAAVLGRRAVIAMAAAYLVVPFALGLLINLLPLSV